MRKYILSVFMVALCGAVNAQVGSYRNDFAVGVNGGYQFSRVAFVPQVPQLSPGIGGITGGVVARYTCEKYFNTICAIQIELNYSVIGWKEKILSIKDEQCVNNSTNEAEHYSRKLTYIQLPLFAHLSWGREVKGANFFLNIGPQVGYLISDKAVSNFDYTSQTSALNTTPARVSEVIAQDTMKVENKIDYGIAAGLGVEYSIPHAGHILLEARYYFGLGNMYGNSKSDYFSRSNQSSIIVKATYLFDIFRTKNCVRK